MNKLRIFIIVVAALVVGLLAGSRLLPMGVVIAQSSGLQGIMDIQHPLKGGEQPGVVPEKGGQEQYGMYEPVADWPKPLTALPGHEKWTWGSPEGIFAESPDRIYMVERGELPEMTRPKNTPIPQFGPSLSFPVNQVPFRNASQGPVAAAPGEGGTGQT